MDLGMVGMGRMGANMTRRLLAAGQRLVVHDHHAAKRAALAEEGAVAVASLPELVAQLPAPRAVWLMIAAAHVDDALGELLPLLVAEVTPVPPAPVRIESPRLAPRAGD